MIYILSKPFYTIFHWILFDLILILLYNKKNDEQNYDSKIKSLFYIENIDVQDEDYNINKGMYKWNIY